MMRGHPSPCALLRSISRTLPRSPLLVPWRVSPALLLPATTSRRSVEQAFDTPRHLLPRPPPPPQRAHDRRDDHSRRPWAPVCFPSRCSPPSSPHSASTSATLQPSAGLSILTSLAPESLPTPRSSSPLGRPRCQTTQRSAGSPSKTSPAMRHLSAFSSTSQKTRSL